MMYGWELIDGSTDGEHCYDLEAARLASST